MNKQQLDDLLIRSGFQMWSDETGHPGGAVDWTADYDQELRKLIKLVATECANICYHSSFVDSEAHAQNILYEFNVDQCKGEQ